MQKLTILIPLLVLVACTEEMSDAERADRDAEAVEMVRRANDAAPPIEEVVPDSILYPDIERHDIFGQACNYAPGTSMAPRVIAREADAFMKIGGEIVRFAADPGARELPNRTRSLYNGRSHSLRLAIDGDGEPIAAPSSTPAPPTSTGTSAEASAEPDMQNGTIWLRDRWDRVVYQGTGKVKCA